MANLPILFSAPMVRAILREIEQLGTGKTQTRRVVNPQPFSDGYFEGEIDCTEVPAQAQFPKCFRFGAQAVGGGAIRTQTFEPRYAVGDRLYVREAWRRTWVHTGFFGGPGVQYRADGSERAFVHPDSQWQATETRWRPGIHMPRWASRLTLIVTDVRVQRLQEISRADAIAEGLEHDIDGDVDGDGRHLVIESWRSADFLPWLRDPVESYADLWDHLNEARGHGWDANPWVAAYTFRPILGNVDQVRP